ncbi:hypothetical protein R1sor_005405 [Riccia sorocarpa]|uniref:Uncharacterized protein n=1 Tax=Riccia sorocarpa TaxID=122646 RepID=A0ABD3HN24_9MARC
MRNAAECQAEEIKRRALEEADLIRSSARLSVEGTPGASTMVERNVEIEASMILRFAQTFAVETRAEATKVLDDARAEAEQLLSSARADAGAIPSSCSALVGDKQKLRRERDTIRKRVKYWKSRSTDESHGVQQPGVAERDLGSRTIRRIVTELINLFTRRTRTSSLTSKRLVCERFWIHRTMKSLQPSSLGCSKLDLSVSTGIKDMRNTLQRVKSSRRTDYLAAKHNLILALAGDNVVTKRYQTSLARALGVKRKNFFKDAKARAALDSNQTQRFPTGVRKTRSDKLSGAVVAVVEDFWRSKSRVSPRKDDEICKRIAPKVYETHQVHWIEENEDWENCSNLEYTGPWTLHNVHPRKPADVVDYVDAIGHGQGIPDQSDEGKIADLVEVGDFFAVEAERPNDYSAEFWILQCTKPLHVLADTTTDAYGETHEEESSVLEGMWYQQFGKSPTCFVQYPSAPVSVVAAGQVIHVRFALQPTGVLKGIPSFKLSKDTLEGILDSLQRYYVQQIYNY